MVRIFGRLLFFAVIFAFVGMWFMQWRESRRQGVRVPLWQWAIFVSVGAAAGVLGAFVASRS